jgi:hypothetical protein
MSNSHSLETKEHHDPCIGNEDASTPNSDPPQADGLRVHQRSSPARPALEQESKLSCGKREAETILADISQHITLFHFELPNCLRWIPDNWTLEKWMTAIRCAVSEWASLLLLIINPSARAMGQVRSCTTSSSFYLWLSKGCIFGFGRYVDLTLSKLNVFLVFLFPAGMLSPPSDPFVTNAERETIILLSVLVAWGLVHVGMHLTSCADFCTDGRA